MFTTSRLKPGACNVTISRCFFFFQAEDGIRDLTVTGVQTCALPISERLYYLYRNKLLVIRTSGYFHSPALAAFAATAGAAARIAAHAVVACSPRETEIGRASCRERV